MIKVIDGESSIEGNGILLAQEFAHLYYHLLRECPAAVYATVVAFDDELKTATSECSEFSLDFALFVVKTSKEKNIEKH